MPISFRWLGVAGIELSFSSSTLLVDPFFTRPPFWKLWFGRVKPDDILSARHIPRADYILVSHSHYDHLMDVPGIAVRTKAQVLGSKNTCHLLSLCGVPEGQIKLVGPGDTSQLGPYKITYLPAKHIRTPGFSPGKLQSGLSQPLRLRDYRMDVCFAFSIEVGGLRLLDCGAANPITAPPANILFVWPGADPGAYAALLKRVKPKLVIPVHWDDMFQPLDKPTRPSYAIPSLKSLTFQRINLDHFRVITHQIAPGVHVIMPGIFSMYDLKSITG